MTRDRPPDIDTPGRDGHPDTGAMDDTHDDQCTPDVHGVPPYDDPVRGRHRLGARARLSRRIRRRWVRDYLRTERGGS